MGTGQHKGVHACDDCQALTDGFRVSSVAFASRLRMDDCGRGTTKMRILGIVALGAALAGCAASRQEVATRLGQQYVGQNVDALVVNLQ